MTNDKPRAWDTITICDDPQLSEASEEEPAVDILETQPPESIDAQPSDLKPDPPPAAAEPSKPAQPLPVPSQETDKLPRRLPVSHKKNGRRKKNAPDAVKRTPVASWFTTLMCMNIPLIGWIYLLWLAFSRNYTQKRDFARAYLLYKFVFLLVALIILGVLVHIGLSVLDEVLSYMEML